MTPAADSHRILITPIPATRCSDQLPQSLAGTSSLVTLTQQFPLAYQLSASGPSLVTLDVIPPLLANIPVRVSPDLHTTHVRWAAEVALIFRLA